MSANPKLDFLGTSLAVTNSPVFYDPIAGKCSAFWGQPYNLQQGQVASIITAFNGLSSSLLTVPPPAPSAPPVPPPTAPASVNGRTRLTGPVIYYISAAGDDASGNGLRETPWATPEYAYNWCRDNLDLGGFSVTVQLLTSINGSHMFIGPLTGQVRTTDFSIVGDAAKPSRFTCSDNSAGAVLFYATEEARFGLSGLTLSAPSPGSFGLLVASGVIQPSDLYFNSIGVACMDVAGPRSVITSNSGALTWNHGQVFTAAATAEDHGQINLSCALVISGSPAFKAAFFQADLGGMIDFSTARITRAAETGPQYSALCLGIVFSGLPPGAPCPLPGNLLGTVNGGYYQ